MSEFFKIPYTPKSKVFFWSDIHECHAKDFILEPRGFTSVDHAKDETRKRWNAKVTCDDTGFLLGDTVVGAGPDGKNALANLLYSLNFKEMYLMPGNHPSGYSSILQMLRSENIFPDEHWRYVWQMAENKKVYLIPNYFEITVAGQMMVLSHYPLLSWNKMGKDAWMLFGHVHNNLVKTDWIRNNYLIGKCIDLGIEASVEPLEFTELQRIMQKKKAISVDHHNDKTT